MPLTITLPVRSVRRLLERGSNDRVKADLQAALAAHDASRTAVTNVRTDSAERQLAVVQNLVNRHLRRFPNTDCSLTLSLKSFFEGGDGSYKR